MPTGTPYNSFIPPYRIRVDDFAALPPTEDTPLLHLLTHTHSDHVNGLSSQSFGYRVVCSRDAKEMLLRHEVYSERELHQLELRAERTRTYSHLRVNPLRQQNRKVHYAGSRDLLLALPLNRPTRFELSNNEYITITCFDANHCPGAVMYLIEGDKGAVLHTGDFRAEPWFLEALSRNPFLQPYLAPAAAPGVDEFPSRSPPLIKTLEAIYLDTACVLSTLEVPTKDQATAGLVEIMKLYPEIVHFFINVWTWGYEDILKAISREFRTKIHVDYYKHSVYSNVSDPFLKNIITQDASKTRFHACERFHRCPYVAVDQEPGATYLHAISQTGNRVIYVNPVSMGAASWDLYVRDTKQRLLLGERINNLLVPLARHSPLPELKRFVAMFRPRRVVPNTLDPRLNGIDWVAIDNMFADCIFHPPHARDPGAQMMDLPDSAAAFSVDLADEDVALKNIVGSGVEDMVERWVDSGKLRKKLETIRGFLGPNGARIVDRLIGAPANSAWLQDDAGERSNVIARRYYDSDADSDNGSVDDERGRTAHILFSSMAGLDDASRYEWWSPPSSSHSTPKPDRQNGAIREKTKAGKTNSQETNRIANQDPPNPGLAERGNRTDQGSLSWPESHECPIKRPRLSLGSSTHLDLAPTVGEAPKDTDADRAGSIPLVDIHNHSISRSPRLNNSKHRRSSQSLIFTGARDENGGGAVGLAAETTPRKASYSAVRARPPTSPPPPNTPKSVDRRAGVSERRMVKLELQALRIRFGEALAKVRPDLVVPSYEQQRARLLAQQEKAMSVVAKAAGTQYRDGLASFETVDDGDGGMDWDRSREIAEAIRADLADGRQPEIPMLLCTDGQLEAF